MNYLDIEEKIIKTQIDITEKLKQREILSKIDNMVGDTFKTSEKLSVTIKVAESLSKKYSLPLKIKGKMLGIGRHKLKYYNEIELRKAVNLYKGRHIPLKLDHREKEVASIVGMVDEIYWNEVKKCIMYKAHINDETHARNVLDGITADVSATIYSNKIYDPLLGMVGIDLEISELSLVYGGAYKENTIEVV